MDVSSPYFHIIQKHYPSITIGEITVLGGNDHDVFIVQRTVVFRFPKIRRTIDPKQAHFLQQLAAISPLPLPTISIHTDEETGISYEINTFFTGESFYPSLVNQFTQEELLAIAKQLGQFLSVVHTFPLEEARKLQLDELNPLDFWDYMENNPNAYPRMKRLTFPFLSIEEQQWVEKLFTDYIALIKKTLFQTRVTHSDIWVYHIIVDTQKKTLSGVIDFWGRIADPAVDFKAFEYYGKDFVAEVYSNYTLPMDEHFDTRRLFYTGHDEVFEFARSIERKDEKIIAKQKDSLSTYIKTHPFT